MDDTLLQQVLHFVGQYLIWPVVGFLTHLYMKVQSQGTDLAVLKQLVKSGEEIRQSEKRSNERELQEIRDLFRQTFSKLDSIEQYLRRDKTN